MGMDGRTKHRFQHFRKKELTTQPCLAHYNGNKENIVTTDACRSGLGIALWQKQNNGDLKPIALPSLHKIH